MPRPYYPRWFRAEREFPLFAVLPGDLVRYNPTASPEITVIRRLPPNHGGLLLGIEEGVFTELVADPSVTSLASARVPPCPPPRRSPLPVRVLAFPRAEESA